MRQKCSFFNYLLSVIIALVAAVSLTIVINRIWFPYYGTYTGVLISDILSGAYTGTFEANSYFILHSLSLLLCKLYYLYPSYPILGIFLCVLNAVSAYAFIKSVSLYFNRIFLKLLSSALAVLVLGTFFFRYAVLMDYRISGALAVSVAAFSYISLRRKVNPIFWASNNFICLLLFLVGFCLNPGVVTGSMPILIMALFYKAAEDFLDKKCNERVSFLKAILSPEWIIRDLLFIPVAIYSSVYLYNESVQAYETMSFITEESRDCWLMLYLFILIPVVLKIIISLCLFMENKINKGFIMTAAEILSLMILCVIFSFLLKENINIVNDDYQTTLKKNDSYKEITDYFKANSRILFILDNDIDESLTEPVFKVSTSQKNYVQADGLSNRLPIFSDKLDRFHVYDMKVNMIKNNVYWVSENARSIQQIDSFFSALGKEIEVRAQRRFNIEGYKEIVSYSVDPYKFRLSFQAGGYDTLFLAQYSADSFNSYYFDLLMGAKTYTSSESLPWYKLIKNLNSAILEKPDMEHVWIEIDPFNTDFCNENSESYEDINKLVTIIRTNPKITFHILLNFPSAEVWNQDTSKMEERIASYKRAISAIDLYRQASICFPGDKEWVLLNPAINDGQTINRDMANTLIGEWIAGYYPVDEFTMDETFDELMLICSREDNTTYVDLSNYRAIFFGDSIIGNYKDATGIAAATESICKLNTFNKAIGGTTASFDFANAVKNYFSKAQSKGSIYIINYGYNDYLKSLPIEGASGYKNGLTEGITEIKRNDPEAMIIVVSPYFSDGTNVNEEDGPEMTDYVEACSQVAESLECYFINAYDDLEINIDNMDQYVYEDRIHLMQSGRIVYTKILAGHLAEWFSEK